MKFCCKDLQTLINNNHDLLITDDKYGWILKWTELTEEPGYTQAHRYMISVSFCPFCGEKLSNV